MKTHKCKSCGGGLMPLWKNNNWFCIECKLEQSLPKDDKPVGFLGK